MLQIFPILVVLDSHGVGIHGDNKDSEAKAACSTEVWYVPEEKMPDWMKTNVEWVKGKLLCPKCQARVGSYNFVSGMKCSCRSHVLPPIHIVKSKVDVLLPNLISQALTKE